MLVALSISDRKLCGGSVELSFPCSFISADNYIVSNVKKHDEIEFFKKFKSVSTYNTHFKKKNPDIYKSFPKSIAEGQIMQRQEVKPRNTHISICKLTSKCQ